MGTFSDDVISGALQQNISATNVGETGGPVPPPAPAGAGSIPVNPGQGHDPNQITQVNTGFGPQPHFGGQVLSTNPDGTPIDDPNPPMDIQVGLTGEGFGTKIDMPSTGMAPNLNKEGLNTALNAIAPNQRGGKTRDLMTQVLKKYYPDLAPEGYTHLLGGMDTQSKAAMDKRRAYGQTEEGRFESRTQGMTEQQKNQARHQQAEQKQREDEHRAALLDAQRRGIPIAPTIGNRPRKLGVRNVPSPRPGF